MKYERLGIDIKDCPGIGDKIQFTSMPENYFKTFGKKMVDVNCEWVFDHNPFVIRGVEADSILKPWAQFHPSPKHYTWRSLAERNAQYMKATVFLRHPRLYRFEDLKQTEIVVHTTGKSQGFMPEHVLSHIRKAYPNAIQVGAKSDVTLGTHDWRGAEFWDVIKIIAQARVFIGVDSSLSWIAACYPKTWNKKLLAQYTDEEKLENYTPMIPYAPHSHWHDTTASYYNVFERDVGFTYSYLKL